VKSNAKKLFLALLVFNVLLILAILGVFLAASNVAQKKSQKISDLKSTIESNDQAIDRYNVLKTTISSNKDLQAIAQKVLPTDKDQSAALADIDAFSKRTDVPIRQINFNTGTNKGAGKTLTSPSPIKEVAVISVSLHCNNINYNNLLNFLKEVENTQRRMQVTSVAITPNSSNPSLLDRVDLSLDIYLKSGT
jgi:Tfp pilus assembly protein PilO